MFVGFFLRVSPINRHLLFSPSTATWLVLPQISVLMMVVGQCIFSIFRKQEFVIINNRDNWYDLIIKEGGSRRIFFYIGLENSHVVFNWEADPKLKKYS